MVNHGELVENQSQKTLVFMTCELEMATWSLGWCYVSCASLIEALHVPCLQCLHHLFNCQYDQLCFYSLLLDAHLDNTKLHQQFSSPSHPGYVLDSWEPLPTDRWSTVGWSREDRSDYIPRTERWTEIVTKNDLPLPIAMDNYQPLLADIDCE